MSDFVSPSDIAEYLIGWIKGAGYSHVFWNEIKHMSKIQRRGLHHMEQIYFGSDCLNQDSYL